MKVVEYIHTSEPKLKKLLFTTSNENGSHSWLLRVNCMRQSMINGKMGTAGFGVHDQEMAGTFGDNSELFDLQNGLQVALINGHNLNK